MTINNFYKNKYISNQITSTKISSLFEKNIRNAVDKALEMFNKGRLSTTKANNLICCPNRDRVKNNNNKWKVFLAGPIQGTPS